MNPDLGCRLPGRTLKSAVGHAGVQCLLAASAEDRLAYASLYGRDQADLILGLERYKALVTVLDGLAGTRQTEALVLDDWWGEPIPGQLATLIQAAHSHTLPKREVVACNNTRYWDRLDAAGARGSAARDPQPVTAAPSNRSPRPNPGKRGPKPKPTSSPGPHPPSNC